MIEIATNTGRGFRRGAVRRRSQVSNSRTKRWVKRGSNGRFTNVKADGKPFKGVTREG